MGRKTLRENREFGLEFYVFLARFWEKNGHETRPTFYHRDRLKSIYNEEFKHNRAGFPFSSVLYGLSRFGEVRVKHSEWVYFLEKIHKWSQPSRADYADKNGIEIYSSDHRFKDGKITFKVDGNSEHTEHLYIENAGNEPVYFTDHALLRGFANFSLETEQKTEELYPGDIHKVKVKYTAWAKGVESAMLAFEFKFKNFKRSPTFHIVRFIEAKSGTTLGTQVSDNRGLGVPTWTPLTIVDMTEKKQKAQAPLADYELPDDMKRLILALERPDYYRDQRLATLKAPLSINNYAEKLHLLLHLEEYHMERKIRKYNIHNHQGVTMKRDPLNKELLVLEITAENPITRGDQLLAYPVGEIKKKYRGYVLIKKHKTIKLGFNKELLDIFVESMTFHIEFTPNRLNLKRQHRAAERALRSGLAPVLFPAAPTSPAPLKTPPDLELFDRKLEENPEQYQAVQHIVAGSSKPAPYLVFGPPGTGKSVTLVEAIKQIIKCDPQRRILACASTNRAVDLLCESLLKDVDKSKVFRIYAKSHDPEDVPENLKACSNLDGNCFKFPENTNHLKTVNITTLLTSPRFVTNKFPEGTFSHVFVDEAGDAEEMKCILPLAELLHPETGQVVLAGDPKQLWPIIKSPFALKYGMGLSLLERLMTDFPLYQKTNDTFDNHFVTKLLRNYRSHPAILKVPNELFYDGELKAFANEKQRNSCCSFELLKQKDFPIIFHEVTSKSSNKYQQFNMEVEVLKDYVKNLLQHNVSPQDIGIIAPYWKQVQKIRQALEKVKDGSGLEVGTVECFQGQERRVILVSTVHLRPFPNNDKWFNVAVTRAKALLIIVGNSEDLSSDPTWEHFISYCYKQGGYKRKD
ncbi:putative helicase mov-10-B.1 [Eucyclogobius newberryi]|uniref:putative helicase mov-10-B.1 n=1 Tax=Eucyclogobius newberryi TaxID=166745 RepID=UPI003B599511